MLGGGGDPPPWMKAGNYRLEHYASSAHWKIFDGDPFNGGRLPSLLQQ